MIAITTTNDKGFKRNLLVSDRAGILKNDVLASRRTTKVESGEIFRGPASFSVEPTPIICEPIRRCASQKRLCGSLEPLRSGEEGKSDNITGGQQAKQPGIRKEPSGFNEVRFDGRDDVS